MVWKPLCLDPSDGVFGRSDLAALCGCHTLNVCGCCCCLVRRDSLYLQDCLRGGHLSSAAWFDLVFNAFSFELLCFSSPVTFRVEAVLLLLALVLAPRHCTATIRAIPRHGSLPMLHTVIDVVCVVLCLVYGTESIDWDSWCCSWDCCCLYVAMQGQQPSPHAQPLKPIILCSKGCLHP